MGDYTNTIMAVMLVGGLPSKEMMETGDTGTLGEGHTSHTTHGFEGFLIQRAITLSMVCC